MAQSGDGGFLEGGLALFRHGPPKTQEEVDKERARSISNGWLCLDLQEGRSLPADSSDSVGPGCRLKELAAYAPDRPLLRDQSARRPQN